MIIVKLDKIQEGEYQATSPACPACGVSKQLVLSGQEVFAYHQGYPTQEVLGRFDAETREKFITGFCGDHWEEAFYGRKVWN